MQRRVRPDLVVVALPGGQHDACLPKRGEQRLVQAFEHAGDWERKLAFAAETRRVAKRYYVQMPAFSFPFEPHYGMPFFHWLPEPAQVWMLQHFALGNYPRVPDLLDATRMSG